MKDAINLSPDKKVPAKETLAAFSLQNLRDEIEAVRQEHGASWENELQRRVRRGIDQLFRVLGQRQLRAEKDAEEGGGEQGSIEAAAERFTRSLLEKIKGEGARQISAENRILLFGGAGTGSELLINCMENAAAGAGKDGFLNALKKEIEVLAIRTLALSDNEGERSGDDERVDDLAGMIAANILEYAEMFAEGDAEESLLLQWGKGTAFTLFPTKELLEKRESRITDARSKAARYS